MVFSERVLLPRERDVAVRGGSSISNIYFRLKIENRDRGGKKKNFFSCLPFYSESTALNL